MNKDERLLINSLIEALEADNTSALRHIAREFGLLPESLLYKTLEAAGVVYATGKEPTRSEFFSALLLIGQEIDSEAIAWGIIERKRRDDRKEATKKTKSFFS